MDTDMVDADFDIDLSLGDAPYHGAPDPQQQQLDPPQNTSGGNGARADKSAIPAAYFEDLDHVARRAWPDSLNIQGVDKFDPNDPLYYAMEHHPDIKVKLHRWVNDYSVNLEYYSTQDAEAALAALTNTDAADPTNLPAQEARKARAYSKQPTAVLFVRQSNERDVKSRDAAPRGDYYRRNHSTRGEYRGRGRGRGRAPEPMRKAPAPYTDFDEARPSRDIIHYDDPPPREGPLRGASDPINDRHNERVENRIDRRTDRRTDGRTDRRTGRYDNREDYNRYESRGDGRDDGRSYSRYDQAVNTVQQRSRENAPSNRRSENSSHDGFVKTNEVDSYRPKSVSGRRASYSEYGRLRDRSASPVNGDGDGRMGFPEEGTRYRERSLSTRRDERSREDPTAERWMHDLSDYTDHGPASRSRSSKIMVNDMGNHHRSNATDETSNAGLGSLLARMTKDGLPVVPVKRSLADRVTRGDEDLHIRGRSAHGMSIRGFARGT
ncbi:hypothetical protein BDV95DRAFT_542501 [Massariosphaeria phaeospora]|uniref:Uncharacterized protein n=1 Tax=Massariosphaeria phaeospora TaxID=100035 RepID=A0A7C8M942_9PLEO|nr:hypothetical protein BDV95DRAFT_542501 [Massariosphaeria phaeospora]